MEKKTELTGFPKFVFMFDKILSLIEEATTGFVFVVMAILVLTGIVSRFILHIPLIWTEELSRYCLVFVVFIGISLTARDASHLGLTIVVDSVPRKLGDVLKFISKLAVIAIYVFLTKISIQFMLQVKATGQHSPALTFLPMWVLYLIMTIGLAMASLREIMILWNNFFSKSKPLKFAEEENWAN